MLKELQAWQHRIAMIPRDGRPMPDALYLESVIILRRWEERLSKIEIIVSNRYVEAIQDNDLPRLNQAKKDLEYVQDCWSEHDLTILGMEMWAAACANMESTEQLRNDLFNRVKSRAKK